jgi:hypothetical protein
VSLLVLITFVHFHPFDYNAHLGSTTEDISSSSDAQRRFKISCHRLLSMWGLVISGLNVLLSEAIRNEHPMCAYFVDQRQ